MIVNHLAILIILCLPAHDRAYEVFVQLLVLLRWEVTRTSRCIWWMIATGMAVVHLVPALRFYFFLPALLLSYLLCYSCEIDIHNEFPGTGKMAVPLVVFSCRYLIEAEQQRRSKRRSIFSLFWISQRLSNSPQCVVIVLQGRRGRRLLELGYV